MGRTRRNAALTVVEACGPAVPPGHTSRLSTGSLPKGTPQPNGCLDDFQEAFDYAEMATRWINRGDFVQSWMRVISAAAIAQGIDKAAAAAIAQAAVDDLRKLHGGCTVYIARGQADAKERARRVIALAGRGLPVSEIAGRVSCTTQRVYQILVSETGRRPADAKRGKRNSEEK